MRVTAGYFVCSMVSRLLRKPGRRFLVWMVFLLGSTAYWLELLVSEFRAFATGRADVDGLPFSAPTVTHSLQVPLAWNHNILIFIQGLAWVYVSTAAGLVGFAVWKHLRLRVLLRHGIEPSAVLNGLFLQIRREMRMSRSGISRAKLVILPGLKSPATAGWWSPRILLPEVCEEIGATPQVADMLSHELIHIARRDYLWGALSELIRCLLFFHPAVWKARMAMALQGELACDLAVLETRPGDRADYADSLTYFVRLRMLQEGFSLGVDFAASTSLGLRIRTILSVAQPLPWWKRFSRMTAGLAMVAVFGIIAPAMTISLGFAESFAGPGSSFRPESTVTPEHVKGAGRNLKHASSHAATHDSLSTLQTQPYAAEAPAFTMTSSSGARPGSERGDQDSPAWQETQPSVRYPSISSIVRSTLGEIAVRGVHGGHDHDKDDH